VVWLLAAPLVVDSHPLLTGCGTIVSYVNLLPLSRLYKSSAVAEMGDRLATIDMGRKVGGAVPLSVGEPGPYLTQCRLGRGLPPYQVAS